MMDTMMQLDARRKLLDDLEGLRQERAYKQKRLERILAHKPIRGCERIAARAQQRYKNEIEDLDRQIGLLEANLEGMSE